MALIQMRIARDPSSVPPPVRNSASAKTALSSADWGDSLIKKNFALFLDVAAAISAKHPQAEFIIAGTGPDETALRAQAKKLALP